MGPDKVWQDLTSPNHVLTHAARARAAAKQLNKPLCHCGRARRALLAGQDLTGDARLEFLRNA